MPLSLWIIGFAMNTLFSYWVVYKGGAERMEGWKSIFIISILAANWNSEQIRFYVFLLWIISFIVFIAGLFWEPVRMGRSTSKLYDMPSSSLIIAPCITPSFKV